MWTAKLSGSLSGYHSRTRPVVRGIALATCLALRAAHSKDRRAVPEGRFAASHHVHLKYRYGLR